MLRINYITRHINDRTTEPIKPSLNPKLTLSLLQFDLGVFCINA